MPPLSLCHVCANMRLVTLAKGSTFFRCSLSATDPRFPKYPAQPVVRCLGFVEVTTEGEGVPRT